MTTLATLLQFSGPAVLGIGALAATLAMCAALLWRPRRPAASRATELTAMAEDGAAAETPDLRPRKLLTRQETDWMVLLDAVIEVTEEPFRLLCHVPLDRIIDVGPQPVSSAQPPLDSARIEYLIIDAENQPVLGASIIDPDMRRSEARRAETARSLLEGAGIPVIEILRDDSDEDVAAHLLALLLSAEPNAGSATEGSDHRHAAVDM